MADSMLTVLGARIREARIATGRTQVEFASFAGYDRNFWGRLERGLQNPTLTTLVRVSAALDVPLSSLLAGLDDHGPVGAIDDLAGAGQAVR